MTNVSFCLDLIRSFRREDKTLRMRKEWMKRLFQRGEHQLHIRPRRQLGGAPSHLNSSAEPSKRLMPRRSQENIKGGDEDDYKWEMTNNMFWQTTRFSDLSPVTHTPFLWGCGPRLWRWAAARRGSVEAEEESGKTTRKMKQAAGAPEIRGHRCCDINTRITH